MAGGEHLISVSELQDCLGKTLALVNETGEPVYVLRHGRPVAAIVDLPGYRELLRLADKGLVAELGQEIERDTTEGALTPWEAARAGLRQRIDNWKPEEGG